MILSHLTLKKLITVLAVFALVSGSSALLGWTLGPRAGLLTSWGMDIHMQPNTAACIAALGLAMLLLSRPTQSKATRIAAGALASLTTVIGGATLVEHITAADLGVATIAFTPTWGQEATAATGRMGPPTALCFVLLGVAALLLSRGRAPGTTRTLGLIVTGITLIAVFGYVFGAPALYSMPHLTGIAFSTAVSLLVLSAAIVGSVPDREPMRTLTANSAAGMMARRAFPVIVLLPLLVGYLRIWLGHHDEVFVSTVRTVVEVFALALLLWWALRAVRDYEQRVARHADEIAEALDRRTRELIDAHERLRRIETLAVLGTLSAGIGHDLANLVLPIRTRLQMIQRKELSSDLREHIDGLARSVDYISDLGTRVRQYTKDARSNIIRAHENNGIESIDLGQWCSEVQPFLKTVVAGDSRLHVECRIAEDLSQPQLNKTSLTQAVYNLVQNAYRAMQAANIGSAITITGYRNEQGDACICVEDDGPGMSPKALADCLDPAYTTAPERSGTGLGLALVKSFVDSHGGELRIYSPPPDKPRGTAVVMRFPTTEQADALPTAASIQSTQRETSYETAEQRPAIEL